MSEDTSKSVTELGGTEIQMEPIETVEDAPAVLRATRDPDAVPVRTANSEITEAPEITADEGDAPLLAKGSSRQEPSSPSGAEALQGPWGWGGWATSLTSAVSTFTEEAAKAAAEVSKTAAAAAKGVVDSIEAEVKAAKDESERQAAAKTKLTEPAAPVEGETSTGEEEKELSEEDKKRLAALERLENASTDSVLGQGLKVFDDSVETITMGAFQALGTAWKGSLNLVHKLEHSAETFAETIQQGGLVRAGTELGPSLLESGMAFTAKAGKALETVSKEALGLLAEETGIDLEKDFQSEDDDGAEKETYAEEVTFDHCFYIYGGPDHLEELEELANHHTLVCSRARAKLSGEERSAFDASLKHLQSLLTLEREGEDGEPAKGKGKELGADVGGAGAEVEKMREASIIKAAEMSSSFTSSLRGLAMAEVVERTTDRLEAIKAEGIHRVSELCALCILHLLQLGKAALASSSKQGAEEDAASGETAKGVAPGWPEDSAGKAELITARAQSMGKDIQAVVASFLTGIGDVTGAFKATLPDSPKVSADGEGEGVRQGLLKTISIEDRATAASSGLGNDREEAVKKLEEGLQQLVYVLLSTTLKSQ